MAHGTIWVLYRVYVGALGYRQKMPSGSSPAAAAAAGRGQGMILHGKSARKPAGIKGAGAIKATHARPRRCIIDDSDGIAQCHSAMIPRSNA